MIRTLPTNKPKPITQSRTKSLPLDDIDHLAELRNALNLLDQADTSLQGLTAKIEKLRKRLNDPNLIADYPDDHPVRIDAEDRLADIKKLWNGSQWDAYFWAVQVMTHGHALIEKNQTDELDSIGREMIHGWGALGCVQELFAELVDSKTWRRLAAAACPF